MPLPLFVRSEIDDMTDITPNAMRVYMHLSRRADAEGYAWPSYQAIGDHCFKSISDNPATRKSHARKAIEDLIGAGLLSKEARERDDGGQSSNGYKLSTVDSVAPPVLIKHPPVPNDTPMLNGHDPCLSGTKDTSIEGTPIDDDGDNARAGEGAVFKAWDENIPGTMTPILSGKLHELIDECGPPAVIYGIVASVEAGARNFKYIAACARNHASGREPPAKANQRAPNRPHANGTSKVERSLSAFDEYEALKARHGVST